MPATAHIRQLRKRLGGKSVEVPTLVLSATLVTLTVVGVSFERGNTIRALLPTGSAVVGAGLVIAGGTAVFYLVFRSLFRWIDGVRADQSGVIDNAMGRSGWTALLRSPMFAVIVGCWVAWIAIQFPGHIPSDTFEQLLQWKKILPPSNHHPWFDSMVFGWFWSFGEFVGYRPLGLFVYLILQAVSLAVGVVAVIEYLKRRGLARRYQWALAWSAALLPPFVMLSAVMTKDSFSAIFVIPATLLYVELVRTRGAVLANRRVAFLGAASVLLLILSKRPNVYIVVVCGIITIVASSSKYRRYIGASLLVILVLASFWSRVVLPVWGVRASTNQDMFSIPTQQTARTVGAHGAELPVNEREAIDGVLKIDGLAEAYDPRYSDPVKARFNTNAPRSAKLAYARVWLVQGFRYPGTYLAATLNNTFDLFAPVRPLQFETSQDGLQSFDERFRNKASDAASNPDEASAIMFDIDSPTWLKGPREGASFAILALDRLTPITTKAFVASWVPFIGMAYARRRRDLMLGILIVPSWLELLVLVAGPVTFSRYITPMMFLALLTVGAMFVDTPRAPREHRQ